MHSDLTLRGTAWTGILVMSNVEEMCYKKYIYIFHGNRKKYMLQNKSASFYLGCFLLLVTIGIITR